MLLYAFLRPVAPRRLLLRAGVEHRPLWINAAGLIVALWPITFLEDGSGTAMLARAFAFCGVGMALLL